VGKILSCLEIFCKCILKQKHPIKEINTAFSPSQLLRLEHAFENNHYVVGQERKELAAGLALTETQVLFILNDHMLSFCIIKVDQYEI
jgi:hypothetical protein